MASRHCSEAHATGTCRRCAFFARGRCRNGSALQHSIDVGEIRWPSTRAATVKRRENRWVNEQSVSRSLSLLSTWAAGISRSCWGTADSVLVHRVEVSMRLLPPGARHEAAEEDVPERGLAPAGSRAWIAIISSGGFLGMRASQAQQPPQDVASTGSGHRVLPQRT